MFNKRIVIRMYSTKNIENILLAEIRNKKSIVSDSLNVKTRNQYKYFNNVEEVKEALNQSEFSEAVEAYKNNQIIYRGDDSNILGAYVIPGIRISAGGISNVYTKLLSDVLPSWSEYPKRNRAAICTNGRHIASNYGTAIYCIFPINNTKIGVCPTDDIWESFIYIGERFGINMPSFNEFIIKIFACILELSENDIKDYFKKGASVVIRLFQHFGSAFKIKIKEYKAENNIQKITRDDIPDFCRYIRLYLDNDIDNDINAYEFILLEFIKLSEKNTSLLSYLNKILNPETNDFQLVDISDIPIANMYAKELWFSAPYLMINEDVVNKIFN